MIAINERSSILGEYEPLGSREEAIVAALRQTFAPDGPAIPSINSHRTSATGLCLSDRYTTRLVMIELMKPRPDGLTLRQYLVMRKRYVEDLTIAETARRLGIHRDTVLTDTNAAIEQIVRLVWHDPTYISGPRVRRLDPDVLAAFWERLARAAHGPSPCLHNGCCNPAF
jgi:predicted DNA-binding protein (UPF0251 family)